MHPEQRRDLLALLRAPGMAPLLDALHASLVRHGEPKGRLKVETRESADALEGLIGKWVRPGGSVAIPEVDRRLREETAFHCSLHEAVELHRGAPIVRPKEEKAREAAAREKAIGRCFGALPELRLPDGAYSRVVSWLHESATYLRTAYGRLGGDGLVDAVRAVALAFGHVAQQRGALLYLAELAQEVAGDAHALDPNRPAGKLFLHALAFHHPETAARETRGSAAWRANLLSEAGIARDPISVRVDTFGLMGDTPYLAELRRGALTRPVNLDDLEIIGGDVRAWRGVAFVVENPTVFAALVRHVRALYVVEMHPTLVCTNGNLNLADRLLLDALQAAGAHLFYAGDFDPRGLGIADAVLERGPDAASPWRMSPADYARVAQDEGSAIPAQALERAGRHLPELVRAMQARGRAVHQEGLIPLLKEDLDRFVTRGATPPRRGGGPGRGADAAVPA